MTTSSARLGAPQSARFLILAVPVLVLLGGLRFVMVPDLGERNFEYMPEMVTGPAVESQSVAHGLPGGLSQQPLVAGVVPRGETPFHFERGEKEAERAGVELVSPLTEGDEAAAVRGSKVYAAHCAPCHGTTGDGRGPAVLRGMLPPPPFQGASAMEMADGQMFHVLKLGRGNMPAMRARLDDADLWRVILHVRALQATSTTDTSLPDSPSDEDSSGAGGGR